MTDSPPSTVASPCISVCELDEQTGMCRGCWRTLDDIRVWSRSTDDEKREIVARAAASKAFREARRQR